MKESKVEGNEESHKVKNWTSSVQTAVVGSGADETKFMKLIHRYRNVSDHIGTESQVALVIFIAMWCVLDRIVFIFKKSIGKYKLSSFN